MKHKPTVAQWIAVKREYILGLGSMAAMAEKHGISSESIYLRNKKEGWQKLRREFEQSQIAALFPPKPIVNPPSPAMPDGTVSQEWLAERQKKHYGTNMELIDMARELIRTELTKEKPPEPELLVKLTTALSSIAATESSILGLRNRKPGKSRRTAPDYAQPVDDIPINHVNGEAELRR